jgi:hypothetical protein
VGALIWRQLVVVTRTPALWVSAALYVSALTAFVLIWGDGIPVVGAASNWQQFTMTERMFLAVLLPWTAARCSAASRRELTLLGLLAAQPPAAVVIATCAALAAMLFAVALAALPVLALMQQIAAVTTATVALDFAPLAALTVFIAAVTTATAVVLENPVRVWAVSGSVTLVALAVIPLEFRSAPIWLIAAVAAFASSLPAARARLTYLAENRA